jgi:hypothetical protein
VASLDWRGLIRGLKALLNKLRIHANSSDVNVVGTVLLFVLDDR